MHNTEGRIVALLLVLVVATFIARSGGAVPEAHNQDFARVTLSVPEDDEVVDVLLASALETIVPIVEENERASQAFALKSVSQSRESSSYNGLLILYVGLAALLAYGYYRHTYALKNYPQFPRGHRDLQ